MGLDVNKILELVRQQRAPTLNKLRIQPLRQESDSDSDSDSDSSDISDLDDSDDYDSNRYARLRNDKLIDLLENVANDKKIKVINTDRIYRKEKPSYALNNLVSRNDKYDTSQRSNSLQSQILEKLLTEGINEEDRKRKPQSGLTKTRLKPNRLLSYYNKQESKDYNKVAETTGLEDYSKVYIVLNPQAVRKSKNKNSLNEL